MPASPDRSRRQVRLSRALGIPLTPKAERLMENRPYPPGMHGRSRRRNESDFAVRLREKQRLRAQYGIREKQMRRAVDEAKRSGRRTGDVLVEVLERRLDAVVLRAGLARTTAQARQAVTHHHVLVDGHRVDKPSYRVAPGQTVSIAPRSRDKVPFQVAAAGGHADLLPQVPAYLDVRLADLEVTLLAPPALELVPIRCDVSKVVEFYAR